VPASTRPSLRWRAHLLSPTRDAPSRYIAKYTGNMPPGRFVDAHFPLSSPVRLFHRSQADIARYLLNYMGRDRRYTEKVRGAASSL
jgi:hypothetical protein